MHLYNKERNYMDGGDKNFTPAKKNNLFSGGFSLKATVRQPPCCSLLERSLLSRYLLFPSLIFRQAGLHNRALGGHVGLFGQDSPLVVYQASYRPSLIQLLVKNTDS